MNFRSENRSNQSTDEELVILAQGGNQRAFVILVERYQVLAHSIALRMAPDQEIARDLVQEAIVQAYLSLGQIRYPERFKGWFCGLVLNVCRNYLRNQKFYFLSLESELRGGPFQKMLNEGDNQDPHQTIEERELYVSVNAHVQKLAKKYREIIDLFYYQHESLNEIAAQLGISSETAKVRLHRARKQLRRRILEMYPEIDLAVLPEQERNSMVRMNVVDLVDRVSFHVVILLEQNGRRMLPIWISPEDAKSIYLGLNHFPVKRPMTHDFLISLITLFGSELIEVRIEALKENTFYGAAKFHNGQEIDARPSDVLALAVRTGCPVYAGEEVMESGGFEVTEEIANRYAQGVNLDPYFQKQFADWKKLYGKNASGEDWEKEMQELIEFIRLGSEQS